MFSSLFTPLNVYSIRFNYYIANNDVHFPFFYSHTMNTDGHTHNGGIVCVSDAIVYHRQIHKCAAKNKKIYNHQCNRTNARVGERDFFYQTGQERFVTSLLYRPI